MQGTETVNLEHTINSGQVFLWEKLGDTWLGVDGSELIVVSEPFKIVSDKRHARRFFRLDDDMPAILSEIGRDALVARAARKFPGLRLARQDPFQCYVSFICSSNSSIQNIRSSLRRICARFGAKAEHGGRQFFTFPSPGRLARASAADLLACGLGFRAKYVREAARAADSGRVDFAFLATADYQSSVEALRAVPGIGSKIADCILLFSLEKMESFPIDRWTKRILDKYYPKISKSVPGKSLTEKKYSLLHERIVEHFGPYAGYSQQFLFKLERELNKKTW